MLVPVQPQAPETLPGQGGAVLNSCSKPDSPSLHPNPHELVTAVAALVNRTVQQQTERSIAQAVTRIRADVISDMQEWLNSKGIPKAVRVAMRESLDQQRKHSAARQEQFHAHNHAAEPDPAARAEYAHRTAEECFDAQLECVQLSLEAGRTPEQICNQFNLNDVTWRRILRVVNQSSSSNSV